MSIGLLGKKIGMTRIYDENGAMIPVTVVDVSDNAILQIKSEAADGYAALQVGYDRQKESRVNKPDLGAIRKAGVEPKRLVREFRLENDAAAGDLKPGDALGVNLFEKGQWVDVIGTSKGKGFQGVYKRYGFGGLPTTHGSMMHRRTGGIAAGTTPGRVWKNARMPGRDGGDKITVQNLKVVEARLEDQVLLISGAVPGAKGGYVIIRPSKKKPLPAKA